jgi:hypothetical protein
MLPSGSFWGHKGQKPPKVFPLAKPEALVFRAEIFFVASRTQSGCVFFFSLKNIDSTRQEKQNTEDTFKNHVFFDVRSFLEAAKFDRNNISKKKKKHAPQFSRSTCKKIFSPIGLEMAEKRRENWFLSPKKLVSRKMQNKKNL